jgi:hypothetical protein
MRSQAVAPDLYWMRQSMLTGWPMYSTRPAAHVSADSTQARTRFVNGLQCRRRPEPIVG